MSDLARSMRTFIQRSVSYLRHGGREGVERASVRLGNAQRADLLSRFIAPGCQCSPWLLVLRCASSKLRCSASDFALGLAAEGIDGVHGGYPFYPTDQPWYRDAVVFGSSGLPWSALQQKPRHFDLTNAHETNRMIVRIEVHESLGVGEARDLVTAIKKIAQFYRAS